jgi:hypothetical protein
MSDLQAEYDAALALRYIDMLVGGVGAVKIGLEDDGKGGADIRVTHVSRERLWLDAPHD